MDNILPVFNREKSYILYAFIYRLNKPLLLRGKKRNHLPHLRGVRLSTGKIIIWFKKRIQPCDRCNVSYVIYNLESWTHIKIIVIINVIHVVLFYLHHEYKVQNNYHLPKSNCLNPFSFFFSFVTFHYLPFFFSIAPSLAVTVQCFVDLS